MGDLDLIGLVLTALAITPGKVPLAILLVAHTKSKATTQEKVPDKLSARIRRKQWTY